MKALNIFRIAMLVIFVLLLTISISRIIASNHLDDLHPDIQCDEGLILKSDVLAVIPLYNNKSIADDSHWCSFIKSLNKTLVMHGVFHTFKEFNEERNKESIDTGILEFDKCFGYKPTEFKPPQLAISRENNLFLERTYKMKVHTWFSQRFHKVYHCNDTGIFPNWIADLI